jgi:hypothetical protein
MKFPIYTISQASLEDFVAFWAPQYRYAQESLYTDNIGRDLTADRIRELFDWKNGPRFATRNRRSIERYYIARLSELEKLPSDTDAESFLSLFPSGGAIWRIFWLHCWQPTRFPIYDQHVHRAMSFIERGEREEIPKNDKAKVRSYLDRYLPFHRKFVGLDLREVDRALWVFGKFISSTRFPLPHNRPRPNKTD